MFRLPRTLLPAAFAVLGLFAAATPASAGWLTIKNDTKHVIVIQETGGPLNRPIRGKCVKLQPGETYREFHLLPGEKTVVVTNADADGKQPAPPERLAWQKDDTPFNVKADGAAFKLVSATATAKK
jgi:hypothetical protein